VENWMNVTARYVCDLTEAQSVCIFMEENGYLRAAGVFGPFPPLSADNRALQGNLLAKAKYPTELLKQERFKMGEGFIGEIAARREDVFVESSASDPRIAELGSLMIPIRSLLAVPLVNDGKVSGVMCAVNSKNGSMPFTHEQFTRFKFIASQVVLAQNIIRVYATLSEQQRIGQELTIARNLQQSLIPKGSPVWGKFEIHAFTRASKEVSGDFFDFVEIDKNRLLVVIGDACGKGIPACMIMAMTRAFIRAGIARFTTLKNMLKELNENLYRDTGDGRYITLGICLLNKKESTLEYIRAGHTEMLVFVRNHIRCISPEGSGVGLIPNDWAEFDTFCMEMTPDMEILLFTDGINEATNPKGEYFGIDRIKDEFLTSCREREQPGDTIARVMGAVDEFSQDPSSQADDQTVVIIRHG
jgi:sigma-B regulation protein RsbU (phosphoserine phosphatase)